MGITEQILQEILDLKNRVTDLSVRFDRFEHDKNEKRDKTGITVEFNEDEKLNASMTARVLGIKQTELDEIVRKGLLQSCEKKKRLFTVVQIKQYIESLNENNKDENKGNTGKMKKKKRKKINSGIKKDKYVELFELNSSIGV